jgi:hypothetical protein
MPPTQRHTLARAQGKQRSAVLTTSSSTAWGCHHRAVLQKGRPLAAIARAPTFESLGMTVTYDWRGGVWMRMEERTLIAGQRREGMRHTGQIVPAGCEARLSGGKDAAPAGPVPSAKGSPQEMA